VAENCVTFVGGNFRQEVKKQRLVELLYYLLLTPFKSNKHVELLKKKKSTQFNLPSCVFLTFNWHQNTVCCSITLK
jgi:hypothetical protein